MFIGLFGMFFKLAGLDVKARKRKFLKTGNFNDIELTDIGSDKELYEYATNPTKLQNLINDIDSKKSEELRKKQTEDRDKLLDKLLNND